MRPLEPRLVATTRPVRVHLALSVAAGLVLTGLVLTQAWVLADLLGGGALELFGFGLPDLDAGTAVAAVAGIAVARAVLAAGAENAALRSAARVVSDLRMRLVDHVTGTAADPAETDPGEIATLAGRGLDGLHDYVARYLPQLVLAALVPGAVVVALAAVDGTSALVVALTLPLIPLFMALIGWHTRARTEEQWTLLERLGATFLDAVEGLPTLAVFRRARATAALVREASEQHRVATTATLKIAFLSALVLELAATLSVAVVAVEIGLRLLYGQLDLTTALFVLILAPEAYLPLRELGARFHASIEGVTAAQRAFAVLDGPGGDRPAPVHPATADPHAEIVLHDVGLAYSPGRPVLEHVDLRLSPGTTTVISGPSGAGKSSLLALLLRFSDPTAGRITVGGIDLADVPVAEWRRHVAWVPQHPYLFDATVADNIRLGAPDASDVEIEAAARRAGIHEEILALPDGYATRLGEGGTRLSSGQRQRIALARAFLRNAPILLLDEPTAHLDPRSAELVRRALAEPAPGRTTLIVTHDERWSGDTVLPIAATNGHHEPAPESPAPAPAPAIDEHETDDVPTGSGLWRLIRFARPRAGRFGLGVLTGAVATGAGVGLTAVAAWLLATASTHPPMTALSLAVVGTRALGLTRGVARYLERLVTHDAALRTLAGLRGRVFERLARTEPVHKFRSGDLVGRFVDDVDATQDLLVRGLAPPLAALLAGTGVVGLAAVLHPTAGLLLGAGLALGGLAVPAAAALAGRGPGRRRTAARAALTTTLVDTLHGVPDLHAYGAVPAAVGRVADADARLRAQSDREARILALGAGASTLIAGLTLWAVLADGIAAGLGTVPLAVLGLTALTAFEIVAPLPAAAAKLGTVRAAARRLFAVLDTPPSVRMRPAPRVPGARGLRIRGLRVRYDDGPWVLDGLDLDVAPGERVAVIGPSGSGKSTLASVLFRFRDPEAGTVLVDGTDVRSLPSDALRRIISGVPQDPHLFTGTVADNLRIAAPCATDAELRAVLHRVRLGDLDPATPVGVGGARLSGGMRQRIALARALLTDAPYLVLDEPTAHLDPATRDALLDDLLAAASGRSLLVITHDRARLDRFDSVVEITRYASPADAPSPAECVVATGVSV
ncbi:ATP-binding cassette, subfamily C, CydCD [Pseudonocardia thermophila]|uniref:ATP-binding cassette, subfamily C, CydCD n=1 Tax=Pseudonocardia thermophila TaxID=1848 RepID=A0A1M6NNR6_PSETH|nr:thiol reductant ABC exporter subunit CydD [Pseudonocardia thermophila]SHJ97333.1 ATP-binding cassette, subfamily C, CydCD [Pseudonocardia thermophila]